MSEEPATYQAGDELAAHNERIVRQLADVSAALAELLRLGFIVQHIDMGRRQPVIQVRHTPACTSVPSVWYRIENTWYGRETSWAWVVERCRVEWVEITARSYMDARRAAG